MTLPKTSSGIEGVNGGREYSEATQEYIDNETERIISERYSHVLENLRKNKDALEHIAAELMDKEVLEADEFRALAEKYTVK